LFLSIFLPRTLPTLILPAYCSMMLTVCVSVTRDAVRHPRHFVFGKFVRKPNCSWSEAFVNRGLTVQWLRELLMYVHKIGVVCFWLLYWIIIVILIALKCVRRLGDFRNLLKLSRIFISASSSCGVDSVM
jgi:hypothetical protein